MAGLADYVWSIEELFDNVMGQSHSIVMVWELYESGFVCEFRDCLAWFPVGSHDTFGRVFGLLDSQQTPHRRLEFRRPV